MGVEETETDEETATKPRKTTGTGLAWVTSLVDFMNLKYTSPLVAQWIALRTAARWPRVRIPGLPESVCVPTLFCYVLRGKIHKLVKIVIDS